MSDGVTLLRGVTAYTGTGTAPTITSDGGGATASIDVDAPDTAVTTVTATGTAPVTFMISGGADASLFQIDAASGDLSFIDDSTAGDFIVIVAATNNWGIDTQKITVTATVPVPYHADAVHFDGGTVLSIASLAATDNGLISIAGAFKCAHADVSALTLYVSDPEGNYAAYIIGTQGANASLDSVDFQAADATGAKTLVAVCLQGSFPADQWNYIIATLNTADGTGVVYNGNTDTGTTPLATGGAFTNAFNGLSFYVGGDNGGFATVDMADLRIMPGIDLRTAGDISVATRRLFVDAGGKPVDPAIATASLGAPCILFSGDATGFATNQGTGGAFTLTGSLTNASTSPSD